MDQQLPLSLDQDAAPPEPPARIAFPLVTDGGPPFDDDERFFEPWWPGTHAFVRRAGDALELLTEHLGDALAVFPELRVALHVLAGDGLIVQGTLLALDAEGRPDARLLRRRLSGVGEPDAAAAGAFVATDLPWLEGRSLARLPFVERRRRLAEILPDSDLCVLDRGVVGEGRMLAHAVRSLGLAAVSARRLDARWRGGPTGDDWLRLRIEEPPEGPARPFLVLMQRLPLAV